MPLVDDRLPIFKGKELGWKRDEGVQLNVQDRPVKVRVQSEGPYHPRLSIENPDTSLSLAGVVIDRRKRREGEENSGLVNRFRGSEQQVWECFTFQVKEAG